MPITDIEVVADSELPLTRSELEYLERYLNAGDRLGFYTAYYNLTGSQQALVQANISGFSESIGGVAYAANALLSKGTDLFKLQIGTQGSPRRHR